MLIFSSIQFIKKKVQKSTLVFWTISSVHFFPLRFLDNTIQYKFKHVNNPTTHGSFSDENNQNIPTVYVCQSGPKMRNYFTGCQPLMASDVWELEDGSSVQTWTSRTLCIWILWLNEPDNTQTVGRAKSLALAQYTLETSIIFLRGFPLKEHMGIKELGAPFRGSG